MSDSTRIDPCNSAVNEPYIQVGGDLVGDTCSIVRGGSSPILAGTIKSYRCTTKMEVAIYCEGSGYSGPSLTLEPSFYHAGDDYCVNAIDPEDPEKTGCSFGTTRLSKRGSWRASCFTLESAFCAAQNVATIDTNDANDETDSDDSNDISTNVAITNNDYDTNPANANDENDADDANNAAESNINDNTKDAKPAQLYVMIIGIIIASITILTLISYGIYKYSLKRKKEHIIFESPSIVSLPSETTIITQES